MTPATPPHALLPRYRQLREQLDAAYTAAVWDSEGIDRIADQMLQVERSLAAAPGLSWARASDG
ncbi:hypothetical protein ACPOLB_25580 [Rubrivivax sp. RP6-9]|uniref:hypothetical protein n=1 Tax=Rubrivivax sp. RP6-9 TaxID=3415750 RepID=UPI003CC5D59F